MIDKKIGQRIKQLRNQWGLSQSDLAERIGISFQQIQKYEKGSSRISVMRLRQIAEALGVRLTSFFEEDETILKVKDSSPKYTPDKASPESPQPLNKEEIILLKLFRKIKNQKLREGVLKQVCGIIEIQNQK